MKKDDELSSVELWMQIVLSAVYLVRSVRYCFATRVHGYLVTLVYFALRPPSK